MGERGSIWEVAGSWKRQGWDDELVFATQAQHLSTCNEELEIRAGFQQFGKQWCGPDDVFKVVQDQEPLLVALSNLEEFQYWLRAALHES